MKPNVLCIVPPYSKNVPPASAAALLGYLKANGCHDFDFIDFRLWMPDAYGPTYRTIGVFGESFVIDVPDLPIVLQILRNFREGHSIIGELDDRFEDYCLPRGIRPRYLHRYLASLSRFFELAVNQMENPRFVGFSCWTSNYSTTLIAAAHLKRRYPDVFIVAGGPQVSQSKSAANLALKGGLFDAVVIGEGEEPLLNLYREFCFGNGSVTKEIPSVMLARPSAGTTMKRRLLQMPNLPLPSFAEMDVMAYQSEIGEGTVLPYQLSRGCTDKCTFCSEWVFWEHFRSDAPGHAVEQIEALIAKYNARHIRFSDSLLNGHMVRLKGFVDEILKRSVKITWSGYMRAQMDSEFAKEIRRAGCTSVFIGVESFSDEVLEIMNKRRTEADNVRAIEVLCQAGIVVGCGLITGFPGANRNNVLETARAFRNLQRKYLGLMYVHPEPFTVNAGQPIFKELGKYGLIPSKWSEEVLDIDPFFREITDQIFCTVTGANQETERMGQTYAAKTILEDAVNDEATIKTTMREFSLPFTYIEHETLSTNTMRFEELAEGWSFGRVKTETSHIYGLLFTKAEREDFEAKFARLQASPLFYTKSVLEWDELAQIVNRILTKHLLSVPRIAPRILSAAYQRELKGENYLMTLSPFTVARSQEMDQGKNIFMYNFASGREVVVSAGLGPLCTFLVKKGRNPKEIRSFLRRKKINVPWEKLVVLLNELKEKGFVVLEGADNNNNVVNEDVGIKLLPAVAAGGSS